MVCAAIALASAASADQLALHGAPSALRRAVALACWRVSAVAAIIVVAWAAVVHVAWEQAFEGAGVTPLPIVPFPARWVSFDV